MSCQEEKLLHFAVLDRVTLGPLACPMLLELIEVPKAKLDGVLAQMYVIRVHRADGRVVPGGAWPFGVYASHLAPFVRQRVAVRWREASGGQELPENVFEGVSA